MVEYKKNAIAQSLTKDKVMKIYQNHLDSLNEAAEQKNEERFAAQQLLEMHKEALSRDNPTIVELGVDKGLSTKVFLNSIDGKTDAALISIDIRDCSNAVDSKDWKFMLSDSADVDAIIESNPIIKTGIDILYVDSLHTAEHVYLEIYGFFPYVKKDGVIYFDDIDSGPYKAGQRKDSVSVEIANRRIFKLLEGTFEANINDLNFEVIRGSTGLAKFTKKSNLGDDLKPPMMTKERNSRLFWRIYNVLTFKKSYRRRLKKATVTTKKKQNLNIFRQ
jgi:predicted O-methyltransferase YrrM